jgi:hypothetical protein
MSYQVDPDGNVTFVCQGKDCHATKPAKSTKVLPKKWCITGILLDQADPESGPAGEERAQIDNARILEANANLSGHFCSLKCAKNTFSDPRVVAMVKKLKVTVVVYMDCKLVIDGSPDGGHGDDGDEDRPSKPKGGGSRDDEPVVDDNPKGINRPGSPPPFTLPESASPGF